MAPQITKSWDQFFSETDQVVSGLAAKSQPEGVEAKTFNLPGEVYELMQRYRQIRDGFRRGTLKAVEPASHRPAARRQW